MPKATCAFYRRVQLTADVRYFMSLVVLADGRPA
jgi:hypothetical protein